MAMDWAEIATPGKPAMSATDEMLADFRRDFGVHTYQIGWLNQTIKQAEGALMRIRAGRLEDEVLAATLQGVVDGLRIGRENAEAEAKKNAQ